MRAVIFDLDETLYPERRFALSAFAAVARHLAWRYDIDRDAAFRLMRRSLRDHRRWSALQATCAAFALPGSIVPELVQVVRTHEPSLRLPGSAQRVLKALKPEWRIGILTNGAPAVQRRKVKALGLEPLVDHVVYACEHGDGGGKPDRAPFTVLCERLRVDPRDVIFVGDDPWRDIEGARRMGMRTIRIRRGVHAAAPVARASDADIVVQRLADVPGALDRMPAPVSTGWWPFTSMTRPREVIYVG